VKKLGFILMVIAAVLVGLMVGTLNSARVQLDLLWVQFELPLGLAILLGFSVGVILGLGMIYLVRVLPLRHQLRKARTALSRQDNTDLSLPDD
jgi:uncharacterized integral membrane protein